MSSEPLGQPVPQSSVADSAPIQNPPDSAQIPVKAQVAPTPVDSSDKNQALDSSPQGAPEVTATDSPTPSNNEDNYDPTTTIKTKSATSLPKAPSSPAPPPISTATPVTSTLSASSVVSTDTPPPQAPPSLPKKPEVSSTVAPANAASTTAVDQQASKPPKNGAARGKSPSAVAGKRKRTDAPAASSFLDRLEEKIKNNDIRSARYWDQYLRHFETLGQFEATEAAYERAVTAFPYGAEFWVRYIQLELNHSEFPKAEQLFLRCLTKIPSVKLWTLYLGYILRMNNFKTGGDAARNIISEAYEFALNHIGIDRDSGPIWAQYLDFIKSKNTQTTWEQQQQMDLIRKTYRRAICIPLGNVEALWNAYNTFENNISKTTARKFIAEKSQAYITARSASKEMNKLLDGLYREGMPMYNRRRITEIRDSQTKKWLALIDWEKNNPLKLEAGGEDLQQRVKYVYRQAATTLWFSADIWFEAAEYSLEATPGDIDDGVEILKIGLEATPLSFLLNYKLAEVYEASSNTAECKKTYQTLINKLKERMDSLEAQKTNLYEELGLPTPNTADGSPANGSTPVPGEGGATDDTATLIANLSAANQTRLTRIQQQIENQAKVVTSAYMAYMKAVKRMEGINNARPIFGECRRLPYATYIIYVASAMMESRNGHPEIATRIFEVGLRRYNSAEYIREYLEFLILINDDTNARALFETSIKKLSVQDSKILYQQFLQYEAEFGELPALLKLESRYRSLYPEESALEMFTERNEIPFKGYRRSGTSREPKTGHTGSGVSKGLRVNHSGRDGGAPISFEDDDFSGDDDEEEEEDGAYSNGLPNGGQPGNLTGQQQHGAARRQNKKPRHDESTGLGGSGGGGVMNSNSLGGGLGLNMGNGIKYPGYSNGDYDGSTVSNNVINMLKALPPAQTFVLQPLDPARLVGMLREVIIPDSLLR